MAGAVCEADPRTLEQRRADALGALGHGADRLSCGCTNPDCAAAGAAPSTVVVHVVAGEDSLTDDTPAQLDGQAAPGPTAEQLRQMTLREALTPPPPTGPAKTPPAALMGGALLPAPLLAAKIAVTAKIVPIVHPGNKPPERRYLPTAVLAWFIRCRDMTCRFPGCDEPAHHCDVDHTIAYPAGPTQASNLKCLCRKHHLLKTFWGWRDKQLPDGTVVWTSPRGPDLHHPPRQPNTIPHPVPTHRPRHESRDAPPRHHRIQPGLDDAPTQKHPRTKPRTSHQRRTTTQRTRPASRSRRTRAQSRTATGSRKRMRRRLFPLPTTPPKRRRPAPILTPPLSGRADFKASEHVSLSLCCARGRTRY